MTKVVAKITDRLIGEMGKEEKKAYNEVCSNLFVVDIKQSYQDCVNFIEEHNKRE